jgi:hypothetical protein
MTGNRAMSELTLFTKTNGPLTKHISLSADGTIISDDAACLMAHGEARRVELAGVGELAALIERLRPNEAIALGALRPGLQAPVKVVTKRKLNGAANTIARTAADLGYRKGQQTFALLDYDTKGMPPEVAAELLRHAGYWKALVAVLPELKGVARLTRRSTSAGISRADTGAPTPGSDGLHVYIGVKDGGDIERFLKTLHARCWLAGLGWLMVGAGGQLLERSIVDRMVGAPERLVFEGGPVLEPPLRQDRDSRRPVAVEGEALDTIAACPPLTIAETSRLETLRVIWKRRLADEAAKVRGAFIAQQAQALAATRSIALADAEKVVAKQCEGVLLPDTVLPFDEPELAGCTVADVITDPARFESATLADPLEGVDYGVCKAQIMRRADGSLWIHSFAHGRTVYELKLDAAAVRSALERVDKEKVVSRFLELTLIADLNAVEIDALRRLVAEKSGAGLRELTQVLKAAQAEQAARRREEARQLRRSQRQDPRPMIPVPNPDEAWLPVVEGINDVLGTAPQPPTRDIDGVMTRATKLALPSLHLWGSSDASLPPPEQWLIRRMGEIETAELIERNIDYVDDADRCVHLPTQFVRHYVQRDDDALPTLVAITTLPLVSPDGKLLAPDGLDRARGIVFKSQSELRAVLPIRRECTDAAIEQAMRYLCDEWLVDVATNLTGKCILIAAALTLIERSLLPDRPGFFVSAGRRGGGKTTTMAMLIMAILGVWPAAAAWSTDEDERRKALLSYFLSGVPYILWDNIARGAQISCPHIEKSCTSGYYSDRKLGASEMVATAAATIHFFTGNNISPRGDLASRSLCVRIEIERPDPENRPFKHSDPVGWTEQHRGQILRALYTILLGNEILQTPAGTQARTRFKTWYRLVGTAIEHAAALIDHELDFQEVFATQEIDEEANTTLAEALAVMHRRWTEFRANDVADLINKVNADASLGTATLEEMNRDAAILRDLFVGSVPAKETSAKSVGRLLRAHVGEPVRYDDKVLTLKNRKARDDVAVYWVANTFD